VAVILNALRALAGGAPHESSLPLLDSPKDVPSSDQCARVPVVAGR
jgi:hypothetical protein